jgi:pimeloyl-ACP methyl ester carboxylesterase
MGDATSYAVLSASAAPTASQLRGKLLDINPVIHPVDDPVKARIADDRRPDGVKAISPPGTLALRTYVRFPIPNNLYQVVQALRVRVGHWMVEVRDGGGIVPDLLDLARDQHGPILMLWGGRDANIPRETYRAVADALDGAGKTDEQVVFSQAGHGFFCDQRKSYNAQAAQQAWALSVAFLRAWGAIG